MSMASPLDEIIGGVALADIDRDDYRQYVEAGRSVARIAGLAPGAAALIINGRVMFFIRFYLCPLCPPNIVTLVDCRADRARRIHRRGLQNPSGL